MTSQLIECLVISGSPDKQSDRGCLCRCIPAADRDAAAAGRGSSTFGLSPSRRKVRCVPSASVSVTMKSSIRPRRPSTFWPAASVTVTVVGGTLTGAGCPPPNRARRRPASARSAAAIFGSVNFAPKPFRSPVDRMARGALRLEVCSRRPCASPTTNAGPAARARCRSRRRGSCE